MDDLISRQAAIDALRDYLVGKNVPCDGTLTCRLIENEVINKLPTAEPEITDEQAIEHLQSTGWMQNHDREMYDMGLKKQLADDSGSYDSLLPSAQPEPPEECERCMLEHTDEMEKHEAELAMAQPKRGRWISADAMFGGVPFYCSECGENTRDTVMGKPRWNYCPNCGADMRGEQ